MQTDNQEFKYTIQDFSNVYFGGRVTYQELYEADDAPMPFKKYIHRVVVKEVPETMMVEEHLLTLTEEQESYLLYKQLKAKIEVVFFEEADDAKGNTVYKSKTYFIEELVHAPELHGKEKNFIIREVHFKKLRLASLSL